MTRPLAPRVLALALALTTSGLACGDMEPSDPLDADQLRPLTTAQGSGAGSTHAGDWTFAHSDASCDCPTLDIDGLNLDLCDIASLDSLDASISEGSGLLAIDFPASPFGTYTGAIEADGSFVVAGIHDASTIVGPLEGLGRIEGSFSTPDQASGSAAQRLLGEVLGQTIDCRWTASFDSQRQ